MSWRSGAPADNHLAPPISWTLGQFSAAATPTVFTGYNVRCLIHSVYARTCQGDKEAGVVAG